jgi:hypothetical protein
MQKPTRPAYPHCASPTETRNSCARDLSNPSHNPRSLFSYHTAFAIVAESRFSKLSIRRLRRLSALAISLLKALRLEICKEVWVERVSILAERVSSLVEMLSILVEMASCRVIMSASRLSLDCVSGHSGLSVELEVWRVIS